MKDMTGFEKWQVVISIVQTGILLMTFLGAIYIGLKQNEINQKLADIAYTDLQPILAFKSEYQDPFKFTNTGKAPAFNIRLFQGNTEGKVVLNEDIATITALGVGYEGIIKRESLKEVSIDRIKIDFPTVTNEIEKAVEKKLNWLALIYRDLNDQEFISIIFGGTDSKNPAMEYKKVLKNK